jgi:hypothetical protein
MRRAGWDACEADAIFHFSRGDRNLTNRSQILSKILQIDPRSYESIQNLTNRSKIERIDHITNRSEILRIDQNNLMVAYGALRWNTETVNILGSNCSRQQSLLKCYENTSCRSLNIDIHFKQLSSLNMGTIGQTVEHCLRREIAGCLFDR